MKESICIFKKITTNKLLSVLVFGIAVGIFIYFFSGIVEFIYYVCALFIFSAIGLVPGIRKYLRDNVFIVWIALLILMILIIDVLSLVF